MRNFHPYLQRNVSNKSRAPGQLDDLTMPILLTLVKLYMLHEKYRHRCLEILYTKIMICVICYFVKCENTFCSEGMEVLFSKTLPCFLVFKPQL